MPCSASLATMRSRVRWEVMPTPRTSSVSRSGESIQPALHVADGRMPGQIGLQRGDGDIAGLDGGEVGVRAVIGVLAGGGDPPAHPAAWVAYLLGPSRGAAIAQAGNPEALDLVPGQIRHVDIEQAARRERELSGGSHQARRDAAGGLEVAMAHQ